MSKLTSYQKLKLENQKLRQDIFNLVRKENEIDGEATRARYTLIYDAHDAIMFGSVNEKRGSKTSGIMPFIKQSKR